MLSGQHDSRLETCVKHCHIHTVASPIAWAALTKLNKINGGQLCWLLTENLIN